MFSSEGIPIDVQQAPNPLRQCYHVAFTQKSKMGTVLKNGVIKIFQVHLPTAVMYALYTHIKKIYQRHGYQALFVLEIKKDIPTCAVSHISHRGRHLLSLRVLHGGRQRVVWSITI